VSAFDAVVLAGGAARRLGGTDKPAVDVAGRSMLDRVVRACAGAATIAVVGPERPVPLPVVWTREDPPGGGPVPALAAGIAVGTADSVVVLAADLPFLDEEAVASLLENLTADAVFFTDAHGKDQPLAAAYRRAPLAAAIAAIAEPADSRLRAVLAPLSVTRLPDTRGVAADCDTWDAVERARLLLATDEGSGEDGRHGRHS
jgi:molybdopterin-guanine dinucleotide biosynthesis protein A